jgi:predicted permease
MPVVRTIETLWREARFAIRALITTPLATAIAVLSLAVTIGGNTAIFSILNGLLLRPLPVEKPSQLVHVTDSVLRETGETRIRVWSNPFWEQIRRRPDLFAGTAAWSFTRFDTSSGGETQFVEGMWVDGGFFTTLGIPAFRGRTVLASDDQPGGGQDGAVAMISYGYWQRQFGGAGDVVGRVLTLNSVPFTVVGIAPPAFFGMEVGRTFDVAAPLATEALVRGRDSTLDSAATNFLSIVGRLKPGQSPDSAQAALRVVQHEIREATTEASWTKDLRDRYLTSPLAVVPAARGDSNLRSAFERPLLVVAGAVALVLVIGCVNIANLLLARMLARRRDLMVRLALGASRWRLARELFMESVVLATAGAALGILFAAWANDFLVQQLSTPVNRTFVDTSIDANVLAFTCAVTVLATLFFGAAPAFRAATVSATNPLTAPGRSTPDGAQHRIAGGLVVIQVTLSVVLLAAAGLFVRSLVLLASRPLGFDAETVLIATIDPQRTQIPASDRPVLYERLQAAVLAVPNVASAAISSRTPLAGGGFTPPVKISGNAGNGQFVAADQDVFGNLVSPGLFSTLGTPVVAGRGISEDDRRGAPRVAVVNEAFARRFQGGSTVIGGTLTVWPDTPRAVPAQIVGIVADAVYDSPRDPVVPMWFVPMTQFDVEGYSVLPARLSVRAASGPPALLVRNVAAAAIAVHPQLALTFRPLADQIHGSVTRERLMAQLGGSIGSIALLLAGLGLYGVTSQVLSQRRKEIGIQMALGATSSQVVRRALKRVAVLVGSGVAAGIVLSLWASRFVEGLVFGVPPSDVATLTAAGLTLLAVAGLAAWSPARRAARADPATVLREG